MVDLKKVIDENQKKLDEIKSEIIGVIETLDNENYKNVLMLRYISFLTLDEIADKLYISLSTVKRWHEKGCEKIIIKS